MAISRSISSRNEILIIYISGGIKMPTLKKIRDTMQKQKIDDEIMAQIDFEADCNNPCNIISLIDKMDKLLTTEQCLSIMEKQGCCKGGST